MHLARAIEGLAKALQQASAKLIEGDAANRIKSVAEAKRRVLLITGELNWKIVPLAAAVWHYRYMPKPSRKRDTGDGTRGIVEAAARHRVDDRTGGGSGEEGGPFGRSGAGPDARRRGAGGSIIEESGCEREEAGTIAGESQQAQTLGSSHAAIGYEGLASPFAMECGRCFVA